MKKVILFSIALICLSPCFSQEVLSNKNGRAILPEKKDFSIGFDASPVFNYLGNIFNDSRNNNLDSLGSEFPLTLSGKYFLKDDLAIRAILRTGFSNRSNKSQVQDLSSTDTNARVNDETIRKSLNLVLGFGLEYRKGNGRLQAFYGPQILFSYQNASTEFNYGNEISILAPAGNPSSATRISKQETGAILGIEAGGFAGVEYFFAPKISFSAEVGISFRYENQQDGSTTFENYERSLLFILPIENQSTSSTSSPGNSLLELDTRPNAGIALNFYF